MNLILHSQGRRRFLASAFGALTVPLIGLQSARANSNQMIRRPIPNKGITIPAIGMGTWITFNVGKNKSLRRNRLEVLKTFFELGGGLVDSSPMYGSSQEVIGWCLENVPDRQNLVSATKVWTPSGGSSNKQIAQAQSLWGIDKFDVMQIHNLVDWQEHLKSLRRAKEEGRIGCIGVTTSHGSRHAELEKIMRNEPIDFVQFTYNILDRQAENRLLPLARERGIAVIINRPFRGGDLFRRFEGKPFAGFAKDFGCEDWAQFFLKFVLSQPAVTCAIPATSNVGHMRQNMAAMYGDIPSPSDRDRMVKYVQSL